MMKYKLSTNLIPILFSLVIFAQCKPSEPLQPSLPHLSVRPEHKGILIPASKDLYPSQELDGFFRTLQTQGDEVCNMFYENIPYRVDVIQKFTKGLYLKKPEDGRWYNRVLHSVVAGCFNFFQMNDKKVHKTFEIIAKQFPDEKECFSVGQMQPYFMHNALGCTRLTMLDADWRILHVHYEILSSFLQNMQVKESKKTIQEIISALPLAWVARFDSKPKAREKQVTIDSLCEPASVGHCQAAFSGFESKQSKLKDIELQLSFLHDANLQIKEQKYGFLFASNALDYEYTSVAGYKKLLENIKSQLQLEQKLFIIYQSGGSSLFGVYSFELDTNGKLNIETVCRDDYKWSYAYLDRGKPYTIYLDLITKTKSPKKCK